MTESADLAYRLTVRFEQRGHAHGVFTRLKTHAAAALAADRAEAGVLARRDGEWIRLYAPSLDALRRAQAVVGAAMKIDGVDAEELAERRSADASDWESFELPEQGDAAHAVAEHHGRGPWGAEAESRRVQAHFELDGRRAARKFAKELTDDGYDAHQAESFVFIYADDADHARRLGEELKTRAPANAQLFFEEQGRTLFL